MEPEPAVQGSSRAIKLVRKAGVLGTVQVSWRVSVILSNGQLKHLGIIMSSKLQCNEKQRSVQCT